MLIGLRLASALLLVLGMLLPFIVDAGALGGRGDAGPVLSAMRWVATGHHIERMLGGLVDTEDLAYFAIVTAAFLVLTKTSVESVRWR